MNTAIMAAETTVITDMGKTVVTDRRYRRSAEVPESLAFQCAHVQEALSLEAVVVSDGTGDRWVGSGDKRLCRLLSKSASTIADDASPRRDLRMMAIQSLRSDLSLQEITTYKIKVPAHERYIYVTGVGQSRMRDTGVVSVADGVKRIMGFRSQRRTADHGASADPAHVLNRLISDRFDAVRWSTEVTVRSRSFFSRSDDRDYAPMLGEMLQPAIDAVVRSGIIVDDLWKRYRWRSQEASIGDGVFLRRLTATLREPRSGARVGTLSVDVCHRHDRLEITEPPTCAIAWV